MFKNLDSMRFIMEIFTFFSSEYSSKISLNYVRFISNLKIVFWANSASFVCNIEAVSYQSATDFLVCSMIFIEY